ncbi:MAG: acetyl-CoA carboxylase biotin carboxylase subunit [Calditrichales bacterium]|nr:MAG: acetyl-CoA carboxylase biotin carboxylase subunit [Calditrichales bacterium]
MFNKVLIANRGEIALRILRACQEMGIKTVAVYSEADSESLHVRFADEVVCIGPAASSESYLNMVRIISAAEVTGADAIHPGYGFLAENPEFAEICDECNITFIGASADVIRKMGNKAEAKETMKKAGVPVVPGSEGIINNLEHATKMGAEIGYPVMLKAVAGGGGRGMRIVTSEKTLEMNYMMASAESENAFGNSDLYMEKYIANPRHIEIQVMADSFGNVVHFGERECSIQRRHQKLVEEAPSPVVDQALREKMGEIAVMGCKRVKYVGAGTIEFLLDEDKNFYFMEMNTRIQVEHPVTEMVYNRDLVKDQIRMAAGEKLGYTQADIRLEGHAIECRINAEDWERNFMPSPGRIDNLHTPGGPGIRVDTHSYPAYKIPPYYDSLIAKLIAYGKDRDEAIARLKRALNEFVIEGIKTTIPFHQKLIDHKDFKDGNFDTGFLERTNLLA